MARFLGGAMIVLAVLGGGAGCAGAPAGYPCEAPILNADQPLTGYTVASPEQKVGNPNAGDPTYVYLINGKEAVMLTGAPVPHDGTPLVIRNPSITLVPVPGLQPAGYRVVVNDELAYDIDILDFDGELVPARVDICPNDTTIESRFTLAAPAETSGVAQMVTIRAVIKGVPATSTSTPVTIETRPY